MNWIIQNTHSLPRFHTHRNPPGNRHYNLPDVTVMHYSTRLQVNMTPGYPTHTTFKHSWAPRESLAREITVGTWLYACISASWTTLICGRPASQRTSLLTASLDRPSRVSLEISLSASRTETGSTTCSAMPASRLVNNRHHILCQKQVHFIVLFCVISDQQNAINNFTLSELFCHTVPELSASDSPGIQPNAYFVAPE